MVYQLSSMVYQLSSMGGMGGLTARKKAIKGYCVHWKNRWTKIPRIVRASYRAS